MRDPTRVEEHGAGRAPVQAGHDVRAGRVPAVREELRGGAEAFHNPENFLGAQSSRAFDFQILIAPTRSNSE